MISPSGWLAFMFCLAGNVFTNVAFKQLMQSTKLEASWANVAAILGNPWAWVGFIGGLTFLLGYLFVLRTVPISVAYPIAVSLGTIGVVLAGAFYFHETLGVSTVVGVVLILVGVILVSR